MSPLSYYSELSFEDHITCVVQACNYHIRSLRHIHHLLNKDMANMIARSIVFSRLDYGNTFLYGVSDHNMNRIQRVQNNLAQVVCTVSYRSSVTGLRHSLHWLPMREFITQNVSDDIQSAFPWDTSLS